MPPARKTSSKGGAAVSVVDRANGTYVPADASDEVCDVASSRN